MDHGFDGALQLPPGFRFHPTDEELVMYYLCRKCGGLPIAAPVIAEVDLYKLEPWRLPEKAAGGGQDSKEWYFFSPRDRKYPNGSRPNRAAGTGYWKATGADKPVGSPRPVAIKKALVFYAGKPPKGVKTNWIMHEYRLADVDRSAAARKKSNNALRVRFVAIRKKNKRKRAGGPTPSCSTLKLSLSSQPVVCQRRAESNCGGRMASWLTHHGMETTAPAPSPAISCPPG
uniref:Predicted protein n=1 Tax=Hordeum vulgare subsp. vulgare TaxID=112509 RepID=F2DJI1_HORVV|nr:predicted protein [Hordeum vulgare subsp. vulgare]